MQGPAATDCYQFEYDALSWFDASDECKKLRGTLAPISNAFVNTWINTNANITFNTYWTGGYMKGGSCTWVDGTQCRYTNWAAGEPTLNWAGQTSICFEVLTGVWYNYDAGEPKPYICKVPAV